VSRTSSHGRPWPRRPENDPAALRADDLAAADPGTRIRATLMVFYGRTAHAAAPGKARQNGTGSSHCAAPPWPPAGPGGRRVLRRGLLC